jgi:riboflavin biosynthesis pyrimidine reductase
LRNESAAVVVGSGTVLTDDPRILVKKEFIDGTVHQPIRVVLDRRGRLDHQARIFKDQDLSKTIWITNCDQDIQDIEKIPYSDLDSCISSLEKQIEILDSRRQIMVEGGAELLNSLCRNGNVKHLRIFRSPTIQHSGIELFSQPITFELKLISCRKLGNGIEEIYTIMSQLNDKSKKFV